MPSCFWQVNKMLSLLKRIFGSTAIDPTDIQAVVNAYGKALGEDQSLVRDISQLPLPKEDIKSALRKAIEMSPDEPAREELRSGYVMLADFQDLAACKRMGLDPGKAMLEEGRALLDELKSLDG